MSVYELTLEDGSVYRVTTADQKADNSPSWLDATKQSGKNLLTGAAGLVDVAAKAINPAQTITEAAGLVPNKAFSLRDLVDRNIPEYVTGDAAKVIKAAQEASVIPVGGPVANAISGAGSEIARQIYPESKVAPFIGGLAGPVTAAIGNKAASVASGAGKAFERASVGAGARSYLKSQKQMGMLEDVETGESLTRLKQAMNEIGDTEGWGLNRTPESLQERVVGKLKEYGSKIGQMTETADKAGVSPQLPFSTAEKVINKATASKGQLKKAFDEFLSQFTDPVDGWDGTIAGLQKWSKDIRNLGFSGEATGQLKANVGRSLQRAIGQDLQTAIKGAMQKVGFKADEIESVFRKYSNYATVAPVIAEQVVKGEATTGASILRTLLRTSGGTLTTPTVIGTIAGGSLGGPIGLAAGAALGAAGSPSGAGAIGSALKYFGDLIQAGSGSFKSVLPAAATSAVQKVADKGNGGANNPVKQGNPNKGKQDSQDPRGKSFHAANSGLFSVNNQAKSNLFKGGDNAGITNLFGAIAKSGSKKNGGNVEIADLKYIEEAKAVMPSLWKQESNNNPKAVGPKTKYGTAKGIGQLLDSTGREWHKKLGLPGEYDPFNEEQNKIISTAYYAWLLGQFKGDRKLALAAYNHGIGNVQNKQVKWGKSFESIFPGLPLQTQQYVQRIARNAGIA